MSRSNYSNDCEDNWQLIRWRGAVESAMNGQRGQSFLKEMLQAIDSLSEPGLIAHELEAAGAVCAIGAVGKARGVNMAQLDPEDTESVAATFGISDALASEIVYVNDELGSHKETPIERHYRMRNWIAACIRGPKIIEDVDGRWADDGGPVPSKDSTK